MIAARIYVNGLGYCGENPDEDYVANVGADGWHVPNVGSLNVLEFSENNVKIITGNRLLRSEIDKILRRLSDGVLDVDEIRIVIEKEGSERAIAAAPSLIDGPLNQMRQALSVMKYPGDHARAFRQWQQAPDTKREDGMMFGAIARLIEILVDELEADREVSMK